MTGKYTGLALLLLALSTSAGAKVYRWVDADGKVHFGDRKPSGQKGQQAKDISKAVEQTNVDASSAERDKLESVFARETKEEKRYKQEQQQQRDQQSRAHQAACAKARKYLRTIQGRVYFVRKDGSEYTVSEKERQAMADKAKADIARHCGK